MRRSYLIAVLMFVAAPASAQLRDVGLVNLVQGEVLSAEEREKLEKRDAQRKRARKEK